jgi:hypothetical protein
VGKGKGNRVDYLFRTIKNKKMAKLKDKELNQISRHELDEVLQKQYEDDAYQYEQWLQSDDYIDFVNEQLDQTKPLFSIDDIKSALDWAKSAINIEPTDIGKDVYDILFIEKVNEHLNKIRYDRF